MLFSVKQKNISVFLLTFRFMFKKRMSSFPSSFWFISPPCLAAVAAVSSEATAPRTFATSWWECGLWTIIFPAEVAHVRDGFLPSSAETHHQSNGSRLQRKEEKIREFRSFLFAAGRIQKNKPGMFLRSNNCKKMCHLQNVGCSNERWFQRRDYHMETLMATIRSLKLGYEWAAHLDHS